MKFLLVGYGKMGRAVEEIAVARGHVPAGIVDPAARARGARRSLARSTLPAADVAFEFTGPATAEANVVALLEAGIPVVCGSTGWPGAGAVAVRRAARSGGVGAVIAPNFSVGMTLFYSVVAAAARGFAGSGLYDPWIEEIHHRGKLDAPSGTARRLAAVVADEGGSGSPVVQGTEGPISPGAIHVVSIRAGHEPGVHRVGFDGEHDAVTLVHRARGRAGFAFGAVLAAEWIQGRHGVHGFAAVVDRLTRRGRPSGGRR